MRGNCILTVLGNAWVCAGEKLDYNKHMHRTACKTGKTVRLIEYVKTNVFLVILWFCKMLTSKMDSVKEIPLLFIFTVCDSTVISVKALCSTNINHYNSLVYN